MRLEFRDDDNGPRHYLDGKPVNCGTVLEAQCQFCHQWHTVRYESNGPISDYNDYLVVKNNQRNVLGAAIAFRWPQS